MATSSLLPAFFGPGPAEIFIVLAMLTFFVVLFVLVLILTTQRRNRNLQNSQLIPCTDCQNPVSRRAETCPHCGAPLKSHG